MIRKWKGETMRSPSIVGEECIGVQGSYLLEWILASILGIQSF